MSLLADIKQAVFAGSDYDYVSAKNIGDYHGIDPRYVLQKIRLLRGEYHGRVRKVSKHENKNGHLRRYVLLKGRSGSQG